MVAHSMRSTPWTRRVTTIIMLVGCLAGLSGQTALADGASVDSNVQATLTQANAGLFWSGDVESGAFAQWHHVHDGANNPANGNTQAQIISSPGRSDMAISLTDNADPGTTDRAEVGNDPATNRGNEGQESYYRFSVYFPSSNRGNWAPKVWDVNNFFQFIGTDWVMPVINLGIDTGDFGTNDPHMFFNFNVSPDGAIAGRDGGRWDLGPVHYDTWTDFIVHVRWSK